MDRAHRDILCRLHQGADAIRVEQFRACGRSGSYVLSHQIRGTSTCRPRDASPAVTWLLLAGSRNPARDAAFHAGVLLARSRGPTLRSCLALTANPDQRALWMNDFENIGPTAVDEIVP